MITTIEFTITTRSLKAVDNPEGFMQRLFWDHFKDVLNMEYFKDCEQIKIMILPIMPKPTYKDRKNNLDAATERLGVLVSEKPGLTSKDLAELYPRRWGHVLSTYDNKLRKLRKEGKVRSEVGPDGLLRWFVNYDWTQINKRGNE